VFRVSLQYRRYTDVQYSLWWTIRVPQVATGCIGISKMDHTHWTDFETTIHCLLNAFHNPQIS
jgi:hypothetical protein